MGSKPIVTSTNHTLPFNKLSPTDFERMCLWLVEREGYERVDHPGAAGSDRGRDIAAWHGDDGQWIFQCKRVQRFGPAEVLKEVEKVLALPEAEQLVGLVFLVACKVSDKAREQGRERCREVGLACEFWAETELDERVKRHPDILAEFFHWPSGLEKAPRQAYEERYLTQVRQDCAILHTEGVDRLPVPLTDIFVMLEAVETSPREMKTDVPLTEESGSEPAPREQQGTPPHSKWSSRHDRPQGNKALATSPPAVIPIAISEALQVYRHLVIMGDPGSGKSTTLQYLALSAADREAAAEGLGLEEKLVPIRADLRGYDPEKPLGDTLVEAIATLGQFDPVSGEVSRAVARNLLREWLSEGRVLILLDGLDEVQEGQRAKAGEGILRLARTEEGQRCRIVVTTRIAGYRSVSEMGEPFFHYCIRPFQGPEDALPYAAGWLRHLAGIQVDEARDQAKALLDRMMQHAGLRRLIGNPLLLRLAIALWADGKEIAGTRAELYRRYVDEVLEFRERVKTQAHGQTEASSEKPWTEQELRASLEVVAWELQNNERRTVAQLLEAIDRRNSYLSHGHQLVSYLRERLGLLVVYGYECGELVAFRHSSFREFFVARYLDKCWDADPRKTWRFLRPRLHDPHWREPILLLAGLIENQTKLAKLVRRVHKAHSPFEGELHRDLLMAGYLLIESPVTDCREFEAVLKESMLLFWDVDAKPSKRSSAFYLTLTIAWILTLVLGITLLVGFILYAPKHRLATFTISSWVGLGASLIAWFIAGFASWKLLVRPTYYVFSAPIGNSRHEDLQRELDELLISLGRRYLEIAKVMEATLKHSDSIFWPRGSRILSSLGMIPSGSIDHFKRTIIESIKADAEFFPVFDQVEACGKDHLGKDLDEFVLFPVGLGIYLGKLILTSLKNRQHPLHLIRAANKWVERRAVESLGEIGAGRPDAAEFLSSLLEQHSSSSPLRSHVQAVRALGKLQIVNERVLNLLTAQLGSHEYGASEAAIESLAKLHTTGPEAVGKKVLTVLAEDDATRCEQAARALLSLAHSASTEAIWKQMLDHKESEIVTAAMVRLFQVGRLPSEVLLDRLFYLEELSLSSYSDTAYYVQQRDLLQALGERQSIDPPSLWVLASKLADSQPYGKSGARGNWRYVWFRERRLPRNAAYTMVSLGQRHPTAVTAVLHEILDEKDIYAQEMAAWALGEIGNRAQEDVDALRKVKQACLPYPLYSTVLHPFDWALPDSTKQSMLTWLATTAALGSLGAPEPETFSALLVQLMFPLPITQLSAVKGLGRAGRASQLANTGFKNRIQAGILDFRIRRAIKKQNQAQDPEMVEASILALDRLGCKITPLVRKLMAGQGDAKATVAHRILKRLVAEQNQHHVLGVPQELSVRHDDANSTRGRRVTKSRGLAALSLVIATILGLASNLIASALVEQSWFTFEGLPMIVTILVFVMSLLLAIALAWQSGRVE